MQWRAERGGVWAAVLDIQLASVFEVNIHTHTHTEIVLKDNTGVHPNQGVSRGHPFKLRGCSLAPLNHCTPTEIRVASKLGVSTLFFLSCLFVWRATRLVSSAFVCAFQSTYGVLLYMRFCRNFVYSSVD